MTKSELESMHISELHALAAEAGVERFRMLRREDLVERLLEHEPDAGDDGEGDEGGRSGARGRRERADRGRGRGSRDNGESRRRRRGEEGRDRPARGRSDEEDEEEAGERTVSGRLEITAAGDGLVHGGEGEAVQVTSAQIRRCELRPGDLIEGPIRGRRRGDRRASLIRVELVNGAKPVEDRGPAFEQLTPVTPTRLIPLQIEPDDVTTRAAELLAPPAFGQRILVRAERHSGRSTLLRGLARAALAADESARVVALLVDERPEEVTEWQRQVAGAEIVDAAADLTAKDQVRKANLALAAAKRQAEAGEDVILLIDSLTRLAVAAGEPSAVKPFFGAGRDLAEPGAGSLTVVGVVLVRDDDGTAVERAVATTESTALDLSAEPAAEGLPPFVSIRPSVAGEELLREGETLAAARRLRSELSLLPPLAAARRLAEKIGATKSNEDLLR